MSQRSSGPPEWIDLMGISPVVVVGEECRTGPARCVMTRCGPNVGPFERAKSAIEVTATGSRLNIPDMTRVLSLGFPSEEVCQEKLGFRRLLCESATNSDDVVDFTVAVRGGTAGLDRTHIRASGFEFDHLLVCGSKYNGEMADGFARVGVNVSQNPVGAGTTRVLPVSLPRVGENGDALSGPGDVLRT
ncbi:hypothetical protein C8R44DRAFT_748945 [Mycena epipterygia]|nr:hypothetical protein C8R44DRAFT_748945 [Mycena epipterygia]